MTKQVLVVRKDLNMRKGKIGAQCAHASLGVILRQMFDGEDGSRILKSDPRIDPWLENSFTKICVTVNSEEELLEIHRKAKEAGILTCLITDNGKTEFNGVPTHTVVAVGPDTIERVDQITKHLPLY